MDCLLFIFICGALKVEFALVAVLVLKGEFSAGMLVAFVVYADQFSHRAASLIDQWNDFKMLGLRVERVADIALTPAEAQLEDGHAGPMPDVSGGQGAINGGITDQQAEKDGYAAGEAVGHALKAIAVIGDLSHENCPLCAEPARHAACRASSR